MPFMLEHKSGVIEFPDETLLVFIDETGHEEFKDQRAPYFGFGGCMCPAPTYTACVEKPWNDVQKLFPEEMLPLHAADLRPDKMTNEQMSAISKFFSGRNFQCFAAMASNEIMNETEESLFHIMALKTCDLVVELARKIRGPEFQKMIMMFEHSERTDKLMADYFRRYNFRKENGAQVPVHYCTMTKKDQLTAGLMVADFVAHTAGSQVRNGLKDMASCRRDFRDIFVTAGDAKAAFFQITRVACTR